MNFCRVCHDGISEDAEACLKYRSSGMPYPQTPYGGFPDVDFKTVTFKTWARCRSAPWSAASDCAGTRTQAGHRRLQVA
jgi:hypothetical protein